MSARGRTENARAHALLERYTLAGQCRLDYGSATLEDNAVDGNILACSDEENVALDDLIGGDFNFAALANDRGALGRQIQKSLDGVGRSALRLGLEELAHRDEHEDHRRRPEIESVKRSVGGVAVGHRENHADTINK